jgi:hypothetical protein
VVGEGPHTSFPMKETASELSVPRRPRRVPTAFADRYRVVGH